MYQANTIEADKMAPQVLPSDTGRSGLPESSRSGVAKIKRKLSPCFFNHVVRQTIAQCHVETKLFKYIGVTPLLESVLLLGR